MKKCCRCFSSVYVVVLKSHKKKITLCSKCGSDKVLKNLINGHNYKIVENGKMTFEKLPEQIKIEEAISLCPDSMQNKTSHIDESYFDLVKSMNIKMNVVFHQDLKTKFYITSE